MKEDFPILKENVIYLDSAATSQKPLCVINKMSEYYKKSNANPHRGAYDLSVKSTSIYDNAHEVVKEFINARSSKEIIFTKNATESLNLIAYSYGLDNLNEGDEVVLSIMEHHSDLVPWQIICKKKKAVLNYMYVNENYEIDDSEFDKITSKTKIVGITHVSNVTGTINDVKKIINLAHKVNAKVVVDASQSIPHMKIDVQDLDCDFLVFSAHKMYGPMGIGVLYGREELLSKMNPFLMGGDMIEYVYEQDTTFAPLPQKFEAGTQNVEGAYGLVEAINYINKIGYDKIQKHEKELLKYAREKLEKLTFIDLYYPKNISNHTSVISFNIKNVHPHDVATLLDRAHIAVRSGNHCAQPLLRKLNIDSTVRISFSIYNDKNDIDVLVNELNKIYEMFKKFNKE
ncbi:MAG: cysteine desulfurase [Bacilli bacterium]|nr:cysteine desulfurase [Bacilli bacterium]